MPCTEILDEKFRFVKTLLLDAAKSGLVGWPEYKLPTSSKKQHPEHEKNTAHRGRRQKPASNMKKYTFEPTMEAGVLSLKSSKRKTRLMKLELKFLLFTFFTCHFLSAQNSLSGTVKDGKNKDIYFATIALYNQADSTVAGAGSSDENGFFEIKNIKDGTYYLEASMLGYVPFIQCDIIFPENNGQALKIKLEEDSKILATVEVTAKLPLLEQKADRLVVNVENNLTSINGSLLDVMKKVPGMLVVGDKLQMAGQQNVTILINGKTTKYMDVQALLKDMPGDNIKKVEVIHQPGAEFEAEGTGPIINIILKKNSLFGTNGSISQGVAKGENWKYRTSLFLSHYQGSMNVHGSLGYRDTPYFDEMHIVRNVQGDIYDQLSTDPGFSKSYRADIGLDWDVTDQHKIGFSSRFLDSRSDNLIVNKTRINYLDEEKTDEELVTENQFDDTWRLLTFNPYYTFEIDTNGHQFDFDFNFVKIKNDGLNILTPEELNGNGFYQRLRYSQPGDTKIYATKLDYTYPFSDDIKMQIGGKYSDASLDNDLGSFVENIDGEWVENVFQSNHFIFDETILAGYGKLTWQKNKWSGTMGLRYEKSNSTGFSVTLDTTLKRDISKLFPSFSLAREITKELGTTFAYSYRIDRPRYSSLNPFVYFLDPFTFEKGNPALRPAFTHSMKFNLTYEKQPFFNVEYKINNNAMVDVTEQDDITGITSLTTVNLESFKIWNISLFFPLDFIPKITGYGGFIANHGAYDSEYLNQKFDRKKWDYTAFLQANFTLPAKIETEVTGWYNSGGQEGIINAGWLYGVDIGLSKKLFNDRLKISFGIENILARYLEADIIYANMDLQLNDRWDGPVYNAQVSYKFGNQHMKKTKNRKGGAAEELRRAQK